MKKFSIINLLISIVLVFHTAFLLADDKPLSVTVDKMQVVEGHSLALKVRFKGKVSGQPDFGRLQTDFELMQTFHSKQLVVTNGVREDITQWTLLLMPRKKGKATVPSISLNGHHSEAIDITVTAAGSSSSGKDKPSVFFTAHIDETSPIVQSQVIYLVRLYYQAHRLYDGVLTLPQMQDALVQELGEKRYQTQRDGMTFDVLERKYALFPQKSGKMTVQGPELKAMLKNADDWDIEPMIAAGLSVQFGGQGKPIRVQAKSLSLDVQPASEKSKLWLPAQSIRISDHWQHEPTPMVGKPITRTVTIQAVGLMAEQLPEVTLESISGVQHYRDTPKLSNRNQDDQVLGTRIETITYIPTREGRLSIPSFKIDWWHTANQKRKTTTLSGKQWEIVANPDAKTQEQMSKPDTLDTPQPKKEEPVEISENNPWMWAALTGASLWILTLIVWWCRSREFKWPLKPQRKENPSNVIAQVKIACDKRDPRGCEQALLAWAKLHWIDSPPLSLGELQQYVSTSLSDAIKELAQNIYAPKSLKWQGSHALWHAFEGFLKQKREKNKDRQEDLPPLNPK